LEHQDEEEDMRIVSKWPLNKWALIAGFCEQGNEPLSYVKEDNLK
jgi:hypothetical protein